MHNKLIFLILLIATLLLLEPILEAKPLDKPADIILLSANNPPYTYRNEQGQIVGTSVKQVTGILETAAVSYDMQIAPWSRAMEIIKQPKTILLYPLSRIPQREDKFQWITPIHTMRLKLYGLKNKVDTNLTNIENDAFKFTCIEGGVVCSVLKSLDINESNILVLNGLRDNQSLKLLVQGRVDFLVISDDNLPNMAKSINQLGHELIALDNYHTEIPEYLAANIHADKTIINKIKQALNTKSNH